MTFSSCTWLWCNWRNKHFHFSQLQENQQTFIIEHIRIRHLIRLTFPLTTGHISSSSSSSSSRCNCWCRYFETICQTKYLVLSCPAAGPLWVKTTMQGGYLPVKGIKRPSQMLSWAAIRSRGCISGIVVKQEWKSRSQGHIHYTGVHTVFCTEVYGKQYMRLHRNRVVQAVSHGRVCWGAM